MGAHAVHASMMSLHEMALPVAADMKPKDTEQQYDAETDTNAKPAMGPPMALQNSGSDSKSDSDSSSSSGHGTESESDEDLKEATHVKRRSKVRILKIHKGSQSPRYGPISRRRRTNPSGRHTKSSNGSRTAPSSPNGRSAASGAMPDMPPLQLRKMSKIKEHKRSKRAAIADRTQPSGRSGRRKDREKKSRKERDRSRERKAKKPARRTAFGFGAPELEQHAKAQKQDKDKHRGPRPKTPQNMPSDQARHDRHRVQKRPKSSRPSTRDDDDSGDDPADFNMEEMRVSQSLRNMHVKSTRTKPKPPSAQSPSATARLSGGSLSYRDFKKMKRAEEEKASAADKSGKNITWIKGDMIGKGAFGTVWKAYERRTGRLLAVKEFRFTFKNRTATMKEFEEETRLMRRLKHTNIVRFYDYRVDAEHGLLYLLMEYVPGNSIESVYKKQGAFSERLIQKYVYQLVRGLEYAHSRGVIHRDVKGKNVLLDNKGVIKIADFGSAVLTEASDQQQEANVNFESTPLWTAPEALGPEGKYSAKLDIWGMGCVIIEMSTAEYPWAERKFLNPMQALFVIGSDEKALPEWPKSLSILCQTFIAMCLQRDPAKRYSAKKLLQHKFLKTVKKSGSPSFSSRAYHVEDEVF